MSMFWEFFTFELKFRFKSVSTYVYFSVWLAFSFLCVASESFGPIASSNGKVLLNGPFAITFTDLFSALFGLIIVSAIFGTAILRDFQRDTFQILFTKPISKFAYLGGRWAGSFVVTALIYTGLMVGGYLGTLAPWADHTRIGPNHVWWYLQPYLLIVLVQIFFTGSLFFLVAALTRRIFIVYLQGVALFMIYLIGVTVFSSTRSLEHFWSGILDPVGLLLADTIARYWSVAEKNSLLFPLDFSGYSPGVFLYNRILWSAVGVAALATVWALFPMSVEALTARSQSRRASKAREQDADEKRSVRSLVAARLPRVRQVFGGGTAFRQYLSLSRLRIRTILREIPFWAIVGLLIVFAINNGYFAGHLGGENVWPVTYLMVQAVEGSATLFFLIVAALYAAELVWRERDTRFEGIHDALPISEYGDWLSKFTAIAVVEIILLAVAIAVGVIMQTVLGYHHYELPQYLEEMYLIVFPQIMTFAMFALFAQTMLSNKFVAHGLVIGLFVLQPVLFGFGWENTLYLPLAVPAYTYSDMNGYGHFVPAIFWSLLYWTSWGGVLSVISIAYTRRGAEDSLRARSRLAMRRAPRLALAGVLFVVLACGSGGWFYYNTHVLNEYRNANDLRKLQADYERQFKKFETVPQPKVTAVDTVVNIYPERRSFDATGHYTLQNKSDQPLHEVHVTDAHDTVSEVVFNRPFHLVSKSARDAYSIYRFDTPLQPGEAVDMSFKAAYTSKGFRDGHELAQFAYNGTFFDQEFLPGIGYDAGAELDDPRRRREQGLGPQQEMAHRGDPFYSRQNLFVPSSDWITYHTVVSTSADQVGIAPGYPVKHWQQDGRNFYEYSMGGTHMADFFAYISARYQVRKEVYEGASGPVNLEVYYDAAHPYNVDEMLEASRKGLEYYEKNFSPFQFKQFRVMEYPRYRSFAQSFPNTVPYSEGIGFITRVEKPTDVDLNYFVTAHELGHQWWAHQLIGGRVEGSNMMSETLAEYSAYMVMQEKFGKDYMHRVMHHFLDGYLRGRAGEVRRERPLALVQNEPYVWYAKGGQIMYTLADYIGVDKVNLALHNFLMQYRYANAANQEDGAQSATGAAAVDQPYPDTRLLVDALRAQTPAEFQYLIDDGFNRIVLYDNKTVSAKSRKIANGKYEVKLEVEARKVQVDGDGVETPMPLSDYIEIGVFSGKKDYEKPLYLHLEKMTQQHATYTVVVDSRPTRAGIDPYNKLIDRIADDNMIDVEE
jgi:ABC-type transport system involved in multi-copper enzyme maturation permease subunit